MSYTTNLSNESDRGDTSADTPTWPIKTVQGASSLMPHSQAPSQDSLHLHNISPEDTLSTVLRSHAERGVPSGVTVPSVQNIATPTPSSSGDTIHSVPATPTRTSRSCSVCKEKTAPKLSKAKPVWTELAGHDDMLSMEESFVGPEGTWPHVFALLKSTIHSIDNAAIFLANPALTEAAERFRVRLEDEVLAKWDSTATNQPPALLEAKTKLKSDMSPIVQGFRVPQSFRFHPASDGTSYEGDISFGNRTAKVKLAGKHAHGIKMTPGRELYGVPPHARTGIRQGREWLDALRLIEHDSTADVESSPEDHSSVHSRI